MNERGMPVPGMQVTAIERAGRLCRVYLNDEPFFSLTPDEAEECRIREDMVLDEEACRLICREILFRRAVDRGLRMLERCDRTEKEIADRLAKDLIPAGIASEAVSYLKERGYLDDLRYCERFIGRASGGESRQMIRQRLCSKGIDPGTAGEAVAQFFDGDESLQVRELMARRHFDPALADQKEREKFVRFLSSRGYGWAVIRTALDENV